MAEDVVLLTLKHETGPSNVIIWSSLIDRHCRVVFAAGMMGVERGLQSEGLVEHDVADHLVDLSPPLARVGELGAAPTVQRRGGLAAALGNDADGNSTPTC